MSSARYWRNGWGPAASRRSTGLSLVELMIAMVLGLVVMGAAFAVFMSNQATFRTSEGLNRIQENARVAFELMARDIRAAGGSGCSTESKIIVETSDEATEFFLSPIAGSAEVLTVRSGDDAAFRVVDSTPTSLELDPDQISDAADVFSAGDLLVLCNMSRTYVVEATSVSGTEVEIDGLGGYDPTGNPSGPPAAVVLARYRDVNWFVQANARGGSSLYVTRAGGAAEEVAEGVSDLDFEYLDGDAGVYRNSPAGIRVIAVRVAMTLTGDDIDDDSLSRTSTHVVSIRSPRI